MTNQGIASIKFNNSIEDIKGAVAKRFSKIASNSPIFMGKEAKKGKITCFVLPLKGYFKISGYKK